MIFMLLLLWFVGHFLFIARAKSYAFVQPITTGTLLQKSVYPPYAFHPQRVTLSVKRHSPTEELSEKLLSSSEDERDKQFSSFLATESSSKGFVSTITNIVNFFAGENKDKNYVHGSNEQSSQRGSDEDSSRGATIVRPPTTVEELELLLRKDYEENNYLWTGKLSIEAFSPLCTFTDPTISFQGTSTFINNLKNLVPIVNWLTQNTTDESCQSLLLDLQVDEAQGYVQSRWNMIGELGALPWRPRINVVGRTKFWYNRVLPDECETIMDDDSASNIEASASTDFPLQVYFYDEIWEIPASQALLQLITPTIWDNE